jgi:hypothetical protein
VCRQFPEELQPHIAALTVLRIDFYCESSAQIKWQLMFEWYREKLQRVRLTSATSLSLVKFAVDRFPSLKVLGVPVRARYRRSQLLAALVGKKMDDREDVDTPEV